MLKPQKVRELHFTAIIYMTALSFKTIFSAVVDFSFVNELVRDRYTLDFGAG